MYACQDDYALQWNHNERGGISNHRRLDCLLKGLFRRRSKKISKLHVTGLCEGNSPELQKFQNNFRIDFNFHLMISTRTTRTPAFWGYPPLPHGYPYTVWNCSIRCANMKWIRWVMLKIQSGHDSVHRRTDGRTDRRTDGQGDASIPPPFQLRWSGGIIMDCYIGNRMVCKKYINSRAMHLRCVHQLPRCEPPLFTYLKISNIKRTKSPSLTVSRHVLQLFLPNPNKPGVG